MIMDDKRRLREVQFKCKAWAKSTGSNWGAGCPGMNRAGLKFCSGGAMIPLWSLGSTRFKNDVEKNYV
jgi:hypothetical protein